MLTAENIAKINEFIGDYSAMESVPFGTKWGHGKAVTSRQTSASAAIGVLRQMGIKISRKPRTDPRRLSRQQIFRTGFREDYTD